jgi:hypothetical protein
MKPAVFQIGDCDGSARLVCVSVPTLRHALELEETLRRQFPRLEVRFLGRFDRVELALSVEEFLDCAASAEFACPGGFEGRMRRLMRQE